MFVYRIHFTMGILHFKLSRPDLNRLLVLHQYNIVQHKGITPDFGLLVRREFGLWGFNSQNPVEACLLLCEQQIVDLVT